MGEGLGMEPSCPEESIPIGGGTSDLGELTDLPLSFNEKIP